MIFYFLALLPVAVWAVQWYFNKEVVWKEAAIGTGAALLVATIFHLIGASGAFIPESTETYSDQVYYAQYQPKWREQYEEAIYRTETYQSGTDSNGNPTYSTRQVFSHWETRRRWHNESWWLESGLGNRRISATRYADIVRCMGGTVKKVEGRRKTGETDSHMIEGTPYDDRSENTVAYVYPITDNYDFEDRLRGSQTLYNFESVPEEQAKGLFQWPENRNKFDTDRLLGTASNLWSQREWDQMNALLGPSKKVNLIAIGFPAGSTLETGRLQERLWNGGKKNDLVLTFGGDPQSPDWAYVFGWTEREAVKRLLENRLRSGEATISEISKLVIDEYELLQYEEKFAHVEIKTPWWFFLIFAIVVLASQGAAHFFFSTNDNETFLTGRRSRYRSRYQSRRRFSSRSRR
jgi:hypothetical protein